MKTWKKYLLSLAATVVLCAAMSPAAFAAGEQSVLAKINAIAAQYPHGSYFSVNGQACNPCGGAYCKNCGVNYMAAHNNKSWAWTDDTSGQCLGFARYVYHDIFGVKLGSVVHGTVSAYEVARGSSTAYSTYQYAKPGDVIYFYNSSGAEVHYGIFISADSSGMTMYNSNVNRTNRVEYRKYDYVADRGYLASSVVIRRANNYPTCSHPSYTFHNDYSVTCNECGEPYIVPTPTGGAYMDVVDVNSTGTAPSHVTPYGDATILTRYNLGDRVYVLGSVKNAFNNTWYQLATGEWLSGEYLDTHIHCVNGKGYCTYCLDQLQLVYMNNTTLSAQSKSFPIHFAPYGDSPKFPTKCSGRVQVNGKIVNCYGNVWYSLSSGGWVWGDYLNTSAQMGTVNLSSGALALNNYSAPSPSQSVELFAIPAGESVYVYPDESIGNWYAVSYGILKTDHVGFAYGPCITIEDDYRGIEPPPGEPEPGLDADDTPSGGDQPSTPPADPGPSGVSVLYPTDPTYVGKFSVSDTNATVVGNIIKPAGSHVTACGVMLFDDTNNLIKEYSETITNVGDSLTSFHAWYDINSEVGVTLTPGTTYSYRITTTINGKNYVGEAYFFTTTGTPPAEDITPPEIVSLTVRGTVSGGAGATVSGGSGETTVQADGTFSFEAPEDTFDVTVKKAGCLTYTVKDVTPNGADVDLGEIKLVQGDVNADEKINMQDLRTFLQNFNKQGEKIEEPLTDVNSDSKVNMQDLRVFLQNFNKTAAKDCTVPYSA